jgi:hypothetical protein
MLSYVKKASISEDRTNHKRLNSMGLVNRVSRK